MPHTKLNKDYWCNIKDYRFMYLAN